MAYLQNSVSAGKRDVMLDVIKSFAIITVVVGHCIQYGSGIEFFDDSLYFDNFLFKFIYSFHMPLFMLISGYLFAGSIHKGWKVCVRKKFDSLVVPILSWSLLPFVIFLFEHWNEGLTMYNVVGAYVNKVLYSLWFLWAVFWCSIVVLIVYYWCRNSLWIYMLLFVISFFVPDIYHLDLYKYMYPYFIIGFLYREGNYKERFRRIYSSNYFLLVTGILFAVLLLFYGYEDYIYTSRHCIVNRWGSQLGIDIYRYAIGFVGSTFVILGLYKVKRYLKILFPVLSYVGRRTMGIYILSGIIFLHMFLPLTGGLDGLNYGIIIVESIGVLFLCSIVIEIIVRFKWLDRFLLGGRS